MNKVSKKTIVSNALLWAAAMIGSALLLKDTGGNEGLMMMLLLLGTCSYLQLQSAHSSKEGENNNACQEIKWLRAQAKKRC
ncbi:MAG: hypothetical protein MI750_16070 [Xanthomonadales bacterium]|nr:hypothetical protein [Xanthomonadales bacterium]